jgi:hypothetical protein
MAPADAACRGDPGTRLGPHHYVANHGAVVAARNAVRVHDLAGTDWHAALQGADDAMVSFLLLVGANAGDRIHADWRWLANRNFVGQAAPATSSSVRRSRSPSCGGRSTRRILT